MLDKSADRISLTQWVDSGEPLLRTVPVRSFERLISRLYDTHGNAEVALYPGRTEQGRSVVRGTVCATVNVICQRCLMPFACELNCTVDLTLVQSEEEADQLPEEIEPALCLDGWFSLEQLVEDELLLALPIVFRHDEAACGAREENLAQQRKAESVSVAPVSATRRQPFTELAALMSRKNDYRK